MWMYLYYTPILSSKYIERNPIALHQSRNTGMCIRYNLQVAAKCFFQRNMGMIFSSLKHLQPYEYTLIVLNE